MLALALVTAGMGFTACEDEPDKYEVAGGTPTINYIRPVDVASKDSLLTSASMSSSICIIGSNLRSVTEILFNDQAAVLNTSYMTDNTIIVTVPSTLPDQVSDKIYFVTNAKDTVAYDFSVIIPAPSISALSNEWAAAGEDVTITGDYFLTYDNYPLTITVGDDGYQIPTSDLTITKTSIKFTMPSDMPKHEAIYITTKYGTTKAAFQYMDDRGMLFDFDNPFNGGSTVLGNWGWHAQTITSDDTSLSGNFLQLGNGTTTMDDETWADTPFHFEYWAGNWGNGYADYPKLYDVADFTDWTEKSLKFEMFIPSNYPWSAAPMQVMFGGINRVNMGEQDPGCNNTWFHDDDASWGRALYMPWNNDNGTYDTGDKWVTVTIPFTDFNKYYDGNAAKNTFSSVTDFASFEIFVITGSANDKTAIPAGTACTPIIKIDNIRVVPNK